MGAVAELQQINMKTGRLLDAVLRLCAVVGIVCVSGIGVLLWELTR